MNQPIGEQQVVDELLEAFASEYPFELDSFQREAIIHLAEGRSVLVAAPTGTGKTVVAEFGIWLALQQGKRVIYTAPLKALSNQKFRDLRARYGSQTVGLVTGDIVEYTHAPIVVMTTEIYRNMLLEEEARSGHLVKNSEPSSAEGGGAQDGLAAQEFAVSRFSAEVDDVGCVIFDELHYLSDKERGPVWEEAIIHSPKHVLLVGLSATVSNADELALWISRVHRPISLVFHTERAIPLDHYYYLDGKLHLVMNAEGKRVERFQKIGGEAKRRRARGGARMYSFGGGSNGQHRPPTMTAVLAQPGGTADQPTPAAGLPTAEREAPEPGEVLSALRQADLLPCLYFLPGRRIVEEAAASVTGHLLTTPAERALLEEEVKAWREALPPEDRELEQVQRLTALLPRGLAYHHAGLLPGLKVLVETLFQRGDLRAVFATDTLALGVNMPARSVVLGSLSKFDGTQMRLLTPNEYQQLTGRAGRRGMDAKGAAIIPYSPWDAFEPAFAALTAPLLPVTSAFTVRYNTVLNLWRAGDSSRLRTALAASLREFQRRGGPDRSAGRADIEYDIEPARGQQRSRKAGAHRHEYALSRAAAAELEGTISVLRTLRYIGEDDELTIKGRLLRALFHPAGMVLTELMVNGALDGLTAPELAEAVSWFTFDDDRSMRNTNYLSQRLMQLRREIMTARRRVATLEYEEGLALSPGIVENFHGVALNWHRGFSLGGLLRRIDLAEGDLLVTLNQTIDLLQQLQGAVGQTLDARDIWQYANETTRYGRYLIEVRARLGRLRPALDIGCRGMLRGSVAQSRAVPSMSTPTLPPGQPEAAPAETLATPTAPADLIPPLPMAEDEAPDHARQDRVEEA